MSHYAASQFLNNARFAEDVYFYKGDDKATEDTVQVIWDEDNLPGTNEVDGDGVVLDKRSGRRIRRSVKIECASTVNVDEHADPPDRFVRGSDVALVKRILARDPGGMMLLLCIVVEGTWDRGKYRMG